MRVVHIGLETTAARVGGLNRYCERLVAAERAAGVEAVAIVLGDAEDASEHVVVATPSGRSMLRSAVAVDRAARDLGAPDVADLHFAGTAAVTATVGALRSVPKVVHFQGPWADESAHAGASRLNVAVKRAVERRVYHRASRVVTLSDAFAEVISTRYGVAPWLVEVIAPGVDLDRFSPGDRDDARSMVGAPRGRVVLAVRRLVARMGLEVLLEAWRSLAPGADDALVIVGDGPAAATLRLQARTLGVEATVRLVGRVDDDALVAWYRAADVTAVPTVALEGYGLVVLESLACGTAVVGTDAGGLREALDSAGCGPAVPAGDAGALADALRRALEAPGGPDVVATRRGAAQRHAWSTVAARHAALYARVVGGARPIRVVVLDHTAVLSGGELAITRAVGALGDRASVHAILAEDGPLRGRLVDSGATVEVLPLAGTVRHVHRDAVTLRRVGPRRAIATTRYVVRLARRLRELRPDVVHTNSLKAALYGGVAARLARVPCVWHVRDHLAPPALPSGASRAVRLAARVLPTVVVANSAATLATVGVDGRVVPSPLDEGIDLEAPRPAHEGAARLAVIGRLAPWKGQRLAIEAFAEAFPGSGEVLTIVGAPLFGEDAYAESLGPLADSLGVGDRVVLAGFVDDVAAVLAGTDILVHASTDPEPFGQVVVEAMGAGCAVLVADAGGPAKTVTDGVDGIRYAMGDRQALATAMRRLAEDPATRARLGAAARVTAAAYTPAALAGPLLDAWAQARDHAHANTKHHADDHADDHADGTRDG